MTTQLDTAITSTSVSKESDVDVPVSCPEGVADTARKVAAVTARNDLDEKMRLEEEEFDRRLRVSRRISVVNCLVGCPIVFTVIPLAAAFGGTLGLAIGTPVVGVPVVGVALGAVLYPLCLRAGCRTLIEEWPEDCAKIWGCEERYKARRLKREAKSESDEKVVDAPRVGESALRKSQGRSLSRFLRR